MPDDFTEWLRQEQEKVRLIKEEAASTLRGMLGVKRLSDLEAAITKAEQHDVMHRLWAIPLKWQVNLEYRPAVWKGCSENVLMFIRDMERVCVELKSAASPADDIELEVELFTMDDRPIR